MSNAEISGGAATPAALGYRMPGEWTPHRRCWMAWPCREATWPNGLDAARNAYAEVARAIAEFEPVSMVCNPADVAEASLAGGAGVEVLSWPINDSWLRDSGPSFLVSDRQDGGLAAVDWGFNGYGNKYKPHHEDAAVAAQIIERAGARRFALPMVMEGGAFHVDGEGTLITTEECLLNPNRNKELGKNEIEFHLKSMLGVTKVIWLPHGYQDDDTDGHVDEVACFVRPGAVLALSCDDPADGNHDRLKANLEVLRSSTDAAGRPLEVVTVPQPPRRERGDGRRLTLSYINFYIANGGIVMPQFRAPEDDRAHRVMREVFPDRRIIRVVANDIVVGGGGIHCITQQEPKT